MENFSSEKKEVVDILEPNHPLAPIVKDVTKTLEQMFDAAKTELLDESRMMMENIEAFWPIIQTNPDRHLYAVSKPNRQEIVERIRYLHRAWMLKIVQQYDRGHIPYHIASAAIGECLSGSGFSTSFLFWPDM
jgi:hypothetical protein